MAEVRGEVARARSQERGIRRRIEELAARRRINLQALHDGAISPDDLRVMNLPLMEEERSLRERLGDEQSMAELEALEGLTRLKPKTLLSRLQGLSVERQVAALAQLYDRIELHKGRLVFVHIHGWIPPMERAIPSYYNPQRGCGVGF